MKIRNEIKKIHQEIIGWRHELHQHPQTAFEEKFASEFIQKKLEEFGIEYQANYGRTGIVATISCWLDRWRLSYVSFRP